MAIHAASKLASKPDSKPASNPALIARALARIMSNSALIALGTTTKLTLGNLTNRASFHNLKFEMQTHIHHGHHHHHAMTMSADCSGLRK
jgi:uracil-DNA glycosylase